ncbi:glutathione S-transferase family protein [Rickettsia endosymbiont of Cardiosporidium cionae]|uniref:glutathione S-transferase family protein n=1 Tax=Rickettsia endosymbiont of Cardiosporidium cionae TaxID=2777155 RepID=UPI001893E6C1|nr:glutathione S-transferase family protein [Rickettsia endosymbiont of Cardiosporidium cionae]KAF8818508.1 glutathione S-transferase family protein [Rickettsia endosymbiont of Cardiosporidium cionae]
MYTLYYYSICPLSRQVRFFLEELNINYRIICKEHLDQEYTTLNINNCLVSPLLLVQNQDQKFLLTGTYSIIEYIADLERVDFFFMPADLQLKAEIRKYIEWFNYKFCNDVTKILIYEKIIKLFTKQGSPRSNFIHIAKNNLASNLSIIQKKLNSHSYLIYDKISCADIVAATHLSIIDYLGDINWDCWPEIAQWYSVIKSRPGFRPILNEVIKGFLPAKDYKKLDI